MKKVFLLLLVACTTVMASAQKVYFIYLQTETQAPFYVRMKDKIFSSAASGFLILPNLTDSTYQLNVGFANSTEPEAKFSIAIRQNDKGFLIKKFDDELALFDFGDLSIVKANSAPKDNTVYETKSDNFSSVLSKAANDPSIVRVPVAKKEEPVAEKKEKKEETVAKTEEAKPTEQPVADNTHASQPDNTAETKIKVEESTASTPSKSNASDLKDNSMVKSDTSAAQQTVKETPAVIKEEPAIVETDYKPSVVTRRAESSTTEGFGLVYLDKAGDVIDTIRILIPSSKLKFVAETEPTSVPEANPVKAQADSLIERKEMEPANSVKETGSVKKTGSKVGCSNAASDKDFMKLRKKMAAQDNDDEMITEAKKEFKNKCYSVEQIRYLSTLFLTAAAKYQFFDTAYLHVSDTENFASLSSEIKDDYYQKRFKALIGE
ncbi:DUF4476 domain-containing protein [Flavisolibacter nicotianae]|uniref:DUF4476 domain-containing protein n=1 Tax=Flavisolibacter nicotianae TaxID=2364882 RepID=UPI000EB48675|nr:DUF4476 domain-containing protein [Flavisolibacter nicotianae]